MAHEVDLSDLDLGGSVVIGKVVTGGGYSTISRGTLLTNGVEVEVAIKALRIAGFSDTEDADIRILKHFYREILVWRTLRHANVVLLLGYLKLADQPPALVSPWYVNGNVTHYLKSHPNPERDTLALDVIDGLEYLHSIPVAHGDLKGENVLVNGEGHASICDFGMSKFMDDAARIVGFTTTNANTGGTDRFMCPELLEDEPKTTATDMWAVSCLIVQILTDEMPYGHITRRQAVFSAIMRGDLPSPDRNKNIDIALWDCMKRCWSITPEDRPNATEFRLYLALRHARMATHLKKLMCSARLITKSYHRFRITFSPDGRYLAVANDQGTVSIWEPRQDVLKPLKMWTSKGYENTPISTLSWSPSQSYLLVGSYYSIKIFVVETNELILYKGSYRHVSFMPDSSGIVFFEHSGNIVIKSLTQTQDIIHAITLDSHLSSITSGIAFSPDSLHVLAASRTLLRVYSSRTGEVETTAPLLTQTAYGPNNISILKNGHFVLVSGFYRRPELWEIKQSHSEPDMSNTELVPRHQYRVPLSFESAVLDSVQPGGARDEIILGILDWQHICVWDRDTALLIHWIPGASREISTTWCSVEPSDIILAVTTEDEEEGVNTLEIWSPPPHTSSVFKPVVSE